MIWAVTYYKGEQRVSVDLVEAQTEKGALIAMTRRLRGAPDYVNGDESLSAYPFHPVS